MWFTSDLHFFHKAIIGMCNRPYSSVQEMNEALIDNWNRRVRPKDRIYILGDFAFAGVQAQKEIVARLNGYKIFVKGNHDKGLKKLLEIGFDDVMENDFIHIGKHKVLVSHFPYHPMDSYEKKNGVVLTENIGYEHDRRYLHKRIVDDGKTFLLHGHCHLAWRQYQRQLNVGVDVWDYKPVHMDKLVQMIDAGPQNINLLSKDDDY